MIELAISTSNFLVSFRTHHFVETLLVVEGLTAHVAVAFYKNASTKLDVATIHTYAWLALSFYSASIRKPTIYICHTSSDGQ